jgi:hypothetical protein
MNDAMVIPHVKHCAKVQALVVQLEGPLPCSDAITTYLAPEQPYTFIFTPTHGALGSSPTDSYLNSTRQTIELPFHPKLQKRATWQRHFPNLQAFTLQVNITAPPQKRWWDGLGGWSSFSTSRPSPGPPQPRYFCYSERLPGVLQALDQGRALVKATQISVQVKCEGCRRMRTDSVVAYLNSSRPDCGCEEEIEAVLRSLLGQ